MNRLAKTRAPPSRADRVGRQPMVYVDKRHQGFSPSRMFWANGSPPSKGYRMPRGCLCFVAAVGSIRC